ncbi:glucose repression mediator protein [Mortierella sp. AD031]|nr:glucose repression mediator protein [Mortierella sp. AD031]KAG0215200.1 glucose repression mediator protein [Mortierella sp. NVP41]
MNAGPGPGPAATVGLGPPPPLSSGGGPGQGSAAPGNNNNNSASTAGSQSAPGGGPAPLIPSPAQRLDAIDEQVWLQIGTLAESMGEFDRAMNSYESALRHNYQSVHALNLIAELYRTRENFPKAAENFQRILAIDNASGEVWGSLGHCYLMMDELQKAYTAYQNALHHLPNPKDSKLWYGIGILYDRYGSVEHAEEAFSAVMRMDPKYEKANEIYFRLGIIYKGQQKYAQSLECFRYILHTPPRPLTEADIWFQIGHVHEQLKEYTAAKEAYERVLAENPNHAKVLQQLGWLYHQENAAFVNQDQAINFLTRSIETDNTDPQSWYLMGRCYMAQQNYNKAYEAYQQAVYRDAKNPTFWCSIGLLYFQINQYRDALDAYSKAIRINPNISEVWFDLGALYEACNNQVNDAIDAYQRALELDPENPHIKQRLVYLRETGGDAGGPPPLPYAEGRNHNAYQNNVGGPNGQHSFTQRSTVAPQGPPTGMQGYSGRQQQGPPAPLMGEHQGRDLSHPGPGARPPGYMGDEKQPHIPGINVGRPPTPAGAMPQMMSGDRPPHSGPPAAPGLVRPPQGPPQSPVPDKRPYGRPGSPAMVPPNSGHGHDPHYTPQHVYGPPPPRGMVHAGPPQGYDRQEEDVRMRQDRLPVYQHQRQRSGEHLRPGNMVEGQPAPYPQRRHPSDPHAHAPTPPRDERRPIAPPQQPPAGYPQQAPQHPDERWAPTPGHHGRHPSDGRPQEMMQQHPGGNRGPGYSRPSSRQEEYQNANPVIPGHPSAAPGRSRPGQHPGERYSHPSNIAPPPGGHPDQHRRDPREQTVGYGEQGQRRGGGGMEYEAGGHPPHDSRMADNRPTEGQDHDEIAASLVSLSEKGYGGGDANSRHRARADDDDYDMEEPESASAGSARLPATQDTKEQSSAPGPRPYSHSSENGQEQSVAPQSGSQAKQQNQDQGQTEERASSQHRGSIGSEDKDMPFRTIRVQSLEPAGALSQGQAPSSNESRSTYEQAENTGSLDAPKADDQIMIPSEPTPTHDPSQTHGQQTNNESDHSATQQSSTTQSETPTKAPSAPTTATQERQPSGSSLSGGTSSGASTASVTAVKLPDAAVSVAEDDDTEMEEGEVREDEDEEVDEVLSSGAVPAVAVAAKEAEKEQK